MKTLYLLCALIVCVILACDSGGGSSDSGNTGNLGFNVTAVEPDLVVHVNTFVREANQRGITLNATRMSNLTIMYGELANDTLGTCSTLGNEGVDIVINEDLRGRDLEWTLMHELGHCILRMNHRDNVLSIMNTFSSDRRLDRQPRSTVFDEFFQAQFFEQF